MTHLARNFALLVGIVLSGMGSFASAQTTNPQPLSAAELDDFGRQIEEIVSRGDLVALSRLYDYRTMVAQAVRAIEEEDQVINAYVLRSGDDQRVLSRQVIGQARTNAGFRYLHTRYEDGTPWLLFRLSADPEFAYCEFAVARRRDGSLSIVDAGQVFAKHSSDTIRLRYVVWRSAVPEFKERFADHKILWNIAKRVHAENDPVKQWSILGEVPEPVAQDPYAAYLRLKVAGRLPKDVFRRACEEHLRIYPKDVWAHLANFLACLENKQYEQAIQTVDEVDRLIGGDPYLDALRAKVKWLMNDWHGSKVLAERAVQAEPKIPYAYHTLLWVAIAQRDRVEALRVLDILGLELGADLTYVEGLPDSFGVSLYREWKSRSASGRPSTTRPGGFKFD